MSTPVRPTVLIVDNDCADREIVRRMLESEFEVIEAVDAESGLARLDPLPDVVLLDHRLGAESGLEALPRFVSRGAAVVLLSGIDRPSIERMARDAGASSFICKTDLTREGLAESLHRLLRAHCS